MYLESSRILWQAVSTWGKERPGGDFAGPEGIWGSDQLAPFFKFSPFHQPFLKCHPLQSFLQGFLEPARIEGMIKWLAVGMGMVSHPTHFYLHSLRWSEHWRAFSSVLVGRWVGLGMNCPRKSALRSVILCFCWMEWKLLNPHPPMSCVSTVSYWMCLLLGFTSVKRKHWSCLNFEGTSSSGVPSSRLTNRPQPGSSVG